MSQKRKEVSRPTTNIQLDTAVRKAIYRINLEDQLSLTYTVEDEFRVFEGDEDGEGLLQRHHITVSGFDEPFHLIYPEHAMRHADPTFYDYVSGLIYRAIRDRCDDIDDNAVIEKLSLKSRELIQQAVFDHIEVITDVDKGFRDGLRSTGVMLDSPEMAQSSREHTLDEFDELRSHGLVDIQDFGIGLHCIATPEGQRIGYKLRKQEE